MYLEQQCIWNNNVSGTTMYLEQQLYLKQQRIRAGDGAAA